MNDREQREDQEPQASEIPDDTIVNIGTEPVGEAYIPQIGTDVVIGSEPTPDDAIRLIGVDRVGKAARPFEDEGDSSDRSSDSG